MRFINSKWGRLISILIVIQLSVYFWQKSNLTDAIVQSNVVVKEEKRTARTTKEVHPVTAKDLKDKIGQKAAEELAADLQYEKEMAGDGWEEVEAPEPELELVELSEELLERDEEALQYQISSTSASKEDYSKLYNIALKSSEYKTKYLSVYALGETYDPEALQYLVKLYPEVDPGIKKEILGWLIPDKSNDTISNFLASEVLHDEKDQELQFLAMNSLAVMDIESTGQASQKILEKLPRSKRETYRHIVETIKKADVSHQHEH